MRGKITTFWGKLSITKGHLPEWHPLLHHCADVAACAEALLNSTLLGDRLARLGALAALDEPQLARLVVLAAFHDLGKFNRGFQAKCGDLPGVLPCGHVREILALFADEAADRFASMQSRLLGALPMTDLERWGATPNTAFVLLVAAIAHHGRPYACARPDHFNEKIWNPHRLGDPFVGIADLVAATRRWFPRAFETGGSPLPAAPDFQHGYAGLVMLADWLGSHCELLPFLRRPHRRSDDLRTGAGPPRPPGDRPRPGSLTAWRRASSAPPCPRCQFSRVFPPPEPKFSGPFPLWAASFSGPFPPWPGRVSHRHSPSGRLSFSGPFPPA